MKDQEIKQKVREIVALKYLKDDEFDSFMELSQVREYAPDEQIIKDGEVSQNLYAVVDGTIRVTVTESPEKEVYICSTGAGQIFGEAGLFLKVKRTADVYSNDTSQILSITRENLLLFFNRFPQGGIKFLMVVIYNLLRKLKESNRELAYERMTDLEQNDVDQLIKDFIQ